MTDMWRSRAPPTPLDFSAISDGSFVLRKEQPESNNADSNSLPVKSSRMVNGSKVAGAKGSGEPSHSAQTAVSSSGAAGGLKDQRSLTLHENLQLFVSRCVILFSHVVPSMVDRISSTNRLAERLRAGEDTISFDKDDDDTLDFVTAASNLRSAAYGIEGKTRWEVKGKFGCPVSCLFAERNIGIFRNGWEYYPCHSDHKRNRFWFDSPPSPPLTP